MSNTIWKFPLAIKDGAQIVNGPAFGTMFVHEQNGVPTIWAEVSPDYPLRDHKFFVVGTGQLFPQVRGMLEYVGAAFCGGFVWHVLELRYEI